MKTLMFATITPELEDPVSALAAQVADFHPVFIGDGGPLFGYTHQGAPVAWLWGTTGEVCESHVAVAPEFEGMALATRLILRYFLLQAAVCTTFNVDATTHGQAVFQRRLMKFGFAKSPTTEGFFSRGALTAEEIARLNVEAGTLDALADVLKLP